MSFLPSPSLEAQAHSERLTERLKQHVQQQSWISFAEFMHRALYEPELGYYVSGSRKLGAKGDFVTAPEISSSFSECLALQCQQIFGELDAPSILEFGAGSGVMAADILLSLERARSLPQAYLILEVSPDLQERQQQTLQEKCPHLLSSVLWLKELPKNFEGVVLANEVLDAMPVHCFEIQNGKIVENGVVVDGGGFIWQAKNGTPAQAAIQERLGPSLHCADSGEMKENLLIEGYSSEICLAIKPWLAALYSSMKRGVVLLVDYGFPEREYYHPDRDQGTLMCHYRHYAHTDPFLYVGLQDITAHVDFTAVAKAAFEAGFKIMAYTNQANFLMSLGVLSNTDAAALDMQQNYKHAQSLKKLLLPSEMGELFKVIALQKNLEITLQGFQLSDDKRRL